MSVLYGAPLITIAESGFEYLTAFSIRLLNAWLISGFIARMGGYSPE